jgi:hypothetical protein
MKIIVTIAALFTAFAVYAEKPKDSPDCAEISKQCEAAGYTPGDHKKDGKGLWVDCIGAVAKGKSVAGVTAGKEQAEKCMATTKEHRKHK